MGQARQRGTFEERREAAIERDNAEREERKLEEIRREASMTPEQRQKRHDMRMLITTMLGTAAGSGLK